MDTLFTAMENDRKRDVAPLAVRMRPRTLDEVVGQAEAVGEGSWLRAAIENDALSSVILFGPAGTGKTSLAHVIAESTRATFVEVSAIGAPCPTCAGKSMRRRSGSSWEACAHPVRRRDSPVQSQPAGRASHAVEDRLVVLVGATTENPFFEVNSALISRSRIIELHSLADDEIAELVEAVPWPTIGGLPAAMLWKMRPLLPSSLWPAATAAGRCNYVELAAGMVAPGTKEAPVSITEGHGAGRRAPPRAALRQEQGHALRHHLRVHQEHAGQRSGCRRVLARPHDRRGEDPKFIARRMYIAASEDIGNADPQALLVAEAAFRAAAGHRLPGVPHQLGPGRHLLGAGAEVQQRRGRDRCGALREVPGGPVRKVPDYLRDRHRPGSENYGEYKYPHSYPAGWVDQRYLPEGLERGCFYQPGERGWEAYRTGRRPRPPGELSRGSACCARRCGRRAAAGIVLGRRAGEGAPARVPLAMPLACDTMSTSVYGMATMRTRSVEALRNLIRMTPVMV